MKKFIQLISLLLLSKLALAQDPFFSQYTVSSMTLNPALVGSHMVSENRASFLTRNQWWGGSSSSISFLTNTIGYEGRLLSNRANKYTKLSLGLMMLNESSNGGILSGNYFSAALSNQIQITENFVVKLAISGTYSNRMLDFSKSTFQSGFGSFGFTNTQINYDPVATTNTAYSEINTGLTLEYLSKDIDYEFGSAIFHANKPKVGFNEKYEIDPRGVAHGTITIRPNKNGAFTFSGNWQVQARKQLFTIGGGYTFNVGDSANHQLGIGIYNRINESVYPYASLRVNDFVIGLSYDIMSAKNKTSFSSLNSSEASLVWEFGKRKTK